MNTTLVPLILRFNVKTLMSLWFSPETKENVKTSILEHMNLLCETNNLPITNSFEEFLSSYNEKRYKEEFPSKSDIQKLLHYVSLGDLELTKIAISKEPGFIHFANYQAMKNNKTDIIDYLSSLDGFKSDCIETIVRVRNLDLLLRSVTSENSDSFLCSCIDQKWDDATYVLLEKYKITNLDLVTSTSCSSGNLDLVKYCIKNSNFVYRSNLLEHSAKGKNIDLCKYLISLYGYSIKTYNQCMVEASSVDWIEGIIFFLKLGATDIENSVEASKSNEDHICTEFFYKISETNI